MHYQNKPFGVIALPPLGKRNEERKQKKVIKMKKLKVLLIATLVMASTSVMAQKGWWLEGNLGFNANSGKYVDGTDKAKTHDFNLGIGANYMISNDWSIGVGLGWDNYYTENTGLISYTYKDYKKNVFSVDLHADYNMKLAGKLYWAPRIYANIGFGNGTYEDVAHGLVDDFETDLFNMQIGVRVLSFNYKLTKNLEANMSLDIADFYYKSVKESTDDWDSENLTNTTYFQFGKYNTNLGDMAIRFGLHWYLR